MRPHHLIYYGGRILSYTLLGGMIGAVGGAIKSLQIAGAWFSIATGTLMLISGLILFGVFPRHTLWEGREDTWLRRLHRKTLGEMFSLRSPEGVFLIGVLTPLLPCGLLYAMFMKAAESGSPAMGALTMLVFGAGIVPALIVTGMVSSYFGLKMRSVTTRLAAITIVLMRAVIIMRGAGIPLPFMMMDHAGNPGDHQMQRMEEHH